MLQDQLQRFRRLARSGPYPEGLVHHHPGSAHPVHVVFGFLVHGNESGTLPAAVRLMDELTRGELRPRGPVSLLLGNPEAALDGRRFLEEDLNRVFTFDRRAESHERRRAEALRPLLDSADFFLDFHQTQTPTLRSFWTFPWQREFGLWARAIAVAPVGLTRPSGQVFSAGTCCLDEYVRARRRIGITVELGQRGPSEEQAEACYRAARRVLELVDGIQLGGEGLAAAAAAAPPVAWYRTAFKVPAPSAEHRLRPGLVNWLPVSAGEELGQAGGPSIPAPASGVVLFPKYPEPGQPPPPELFRLGVLAREHAGEPLLTDE